MCLTYPGEVIALDGLDAVVRIDGRLRRASAIAAAETRVGDWVIVAAGSVIGRLSSAEARDLERMLRVAYGQEGSRDDVDDG